MAEKYDLEKWRRPDGSLPPFIPSGEPYMGWREIAGLWGLGLASIAFFGAIIFAIGAVLWLIMEAIT